MECSSIAGLLLPAVVLLAASRVLPDDAARPEAVDRHPDPAAAAVSIVSYFVHPESVVEHYGGGLLVASRGARAGDRIILVTARHVLEGSDYSVVTLRDSGSASGLGRISVTVPTREDTTVFYPREDVDLAALVIDGAMDDDEELTAFISKSLPVEDLSFAERQAEGDSVIAFVRVVDPLLWFSAGRQQALHGVLMPVPPDERNVFVDLRPLPGYSGSPVFASGGDMDDDALLQGIIVAGYVEINPDEYRVLDLSVITETPLSGFPSFLALEPAAEVRELLESIR
jgi:hypothetical protein